MLFFFIFVVVIASDVLAVPQFTVPENARELYEEFKLKYKDYRRNEADNDDKRFEIFKENLVRAQIHEYHDSGTAKYGVTRFSDLTAEEFRQFFRRTKITGELDADIVIEAQSLDDQPKMYDWRQFGAVGPVLDQGFCGSCWAFSVVGNIEGQWYRKTDELFKFSKQQLVDCDKYDNGCSGGDPLQAYNAIKMMGGLETERSYPYKGEQEECKVQPGHFVAFINDSVQIKGDETAIAGELVNRGPLSMCLNAEYLQFYLRGISHPPEDLCSASGIDHAVLGIGYGEDEEGRPYWLLKNSWGINWGEEGYFRLYRGEKTCGITELVSTSIIH